MVYSNFGLYYHIIDIRFHVPTQLWLEHFGDQPLEGCASILETEWHYFIVVSAKRNDEGGMHLVSGVHLNLFISRKSIHKAQEYMTRGAVH